MLRADQNGLISDRAFWMGLAVYALLFVGAVPAFAGPTANEILFASGTVIFERSVRPETTVTDRPNVSQYLGAVTLTSSFSSSNSIGASQLIGNTFRADLISAHLPDSTPRIVSSAVRAPQIFSGTTAEGMSALQIALGGQDWTIDGDIVPVPESPTWWAAILVAGSVAWSQRRRIAGQFVR